MRIGKAKDIADKDMNIDVTWKEIARKHVHFVEVTCALCFFKSLSDNDRVEGNWEGGKRYYDSRNYDSRVFRA